MYITILLIHFFSFVLQLFSSKRGIRLPHWVYYWQTGKPGMDDSFASNNTDAVRFPMYIQKEVWQIAPA